MAPFMKMRLYKLLLKKFRESFEKANLNDFEYLIKFLNTLIKQLLK